MSNRFIEGRVQRLDAANDQWLMIDTETGDVVQRKRGGPWLCVRVEGKPIRKMTRREPSPLATAT